MERDVPYGPHEGTFLIGKGLVGPEVCGSVHVIRVILVKEA